MKERRKFTVALKRDVVEELLSRASTVAQLSRRLDVSSGLILHWKKRYEAGCVVTLHLKLTGCRVHDSFQ